MIKQEIRSSTDPDSEIRDQQVISTKKNIPEILKKGIWYFAHPYSNNQKANYEKCIQSTNKLLDLDIMVFSPIILTHPLAQQKHRTYTFWMNFDGMYWEFMQGIILPMNWESSKGCKIEKEWFEQHNKPIIIFNEIKNELYSFR